MKPLGFLGMCQDVSTCRETENLFDTYTVQAKSMSAQPLTVCAAVCMYHSRLFCISDGSPFLHCHYMGDVCAICVIFWTFLPSSELDLRHSEPKIGTPAEGNGHNWFF